VVNDQGSGTTHPSARAYATTWTDQNGNFWLFGGQGINSAGTTIYLNDLWCFTPNYTTSTPACNSENGAQTPAANPGAPITKGTWTQVIAGNSSGNGTGVYGSAQTPAATNLPGGRINAQAWVDGTGKLWMFGGGGYDSTGASGSLSDVWMFDPKAPSNKLWWTFESGSAAVNANEVPGAKQGAFASGNTPSGRLGTIGWTDSTGTKLWLFGGSGSDTTATTSTNDGGGALNEIWVYDTQRHLWAFVAGTTVTINTAGGTTPSTGGGGVAGSAGYYPVQGTTSAWDIPGSRLWSNVWVDSNYNVWIFGGTGNDAVGTSGNLNDLWLMQMTAPPQ